MSDDTHSKVAAAVKVRSIRAVARALEMPDSTVASYLAGAAREGTRFLIASRADRLDALLAARPVARSFSRPTAA